MTRRALLLLALLCVASAVVAATFGSSGASAQTPMVGVEEATADDPTDILECPEPSPSPSPTETLDTDPVDATLDDGDEEDCDEDEEEDKKKNNGGNRGGRKDDPVDPDPKKNNDPDNPKRGGDQGNDNKRGPKSNREGDDNKGTKKKKTDVTTAPPAGGAPQKFTATGEYNTDELQLVAARLRARGLSEEEIIERVYTPFIIAGPAAWTNTWGAPRYGPGPIVRTHEGQDVFCKYGDPVLATEEGTIEFDDGGLGGIVARLFRKDGSYWYYAHLSGVNSKEFSNGDRVEAGDVIGYCGNTGNAITTPPHVHFGWYSAGGVDSKNPMGMLVKWLRMAETNAGAASEKVFGKSLEELAESPSSLRRFGDGFAPDISELKVSSEALLAASSSPGAGAFGLAEAALEAALAAQTETIYDPAAFDNGASAGHTESRIAELLEETSASPSGDSSD